MDWRYTREKTEKKDQRPRAHCDLFPCKMGTVKSQRDTSDENCSDANFDIKIYVRLLRVAYQLASKGKNFKQETIQDFQDFSDLVIANTS